MVYIIVKYADYFYRPYNFASDYIFTREDSSHNTHSGERCGCEPYYEDHAKALEMLEKMTMLNPSVGYAIVKVE